MSQDIIFQEYPEVINDELRIMALATVGPPLFALCAYPYALTTLLVDR